MAAADFQWKGYYCGYGDDRYVGKVGGKGEVKPGAEIQDRGKDRGNKKDASAAPFGGDAVAKGRCHRTAGEPCVPKILHDVPRNLRGMVENDKTCRYEQEYCDRLEEDPHFFLLLFVFCIIM